MIHSAALNSSAYKWSMAQFYFNRLSTGMHACRNKMGYIWI